MNHTDFNEICRNLVSVLVWKLWAYKIFENFVQNRNFIFFRNWFRTTN